KPQEQRRPADMSKGLRQMVKELRQLPGSRGTSQKLGDLHKDNGHGNAADKSSHYRGGDKVYDPVCVEKVKQQEPETSKKSNGRDIVHGGAAFKGNAQ